MNQISILRAVNVAILVLLALSVFAPDSSAQDKPKPQILFTNCNIFDGKANNLAKGQNVLVEANLISKIGEGMKGRSDAKIIDCGGRTLMPGLADTHTHLMFASLPLGQLLTGDTGYNYISSTWNAETFLMNGVTFVRDMAGNSFGLKRAIDEGITPGPRIYPSGSMISQTGGHGDFRLRNQANPIFKQNDVAVFDLGTAQIVDGAPLVLSAARENLRKGASQIKLAAGGGYGSPADPLMGNQFTFEEIKAAVDTAADWETYVTVHSYHPSSINRAIDAGIKDVGHGQLLDKATLQRMADEGVFLSAQPFTLCNEPQLNDFSNAKLAIVCKGTEFVYKTAKEIPNLKVTYGTDLFNLPKEEVGQSVKQMERLLKWYKPGEILKMATGNAGELMKMTGLRNPYPDGDLGVVAPGAYADLLIVDGNPLEDLSAVTDNTNIKIIMKDGEFFKNTLK